MICGIDTGTATCGWARFDRDARRFDGIGALGLERNEARKKLDDYGDRIATVAEVLRDRIEGCNTVIVERMSFPPGGQVPVALGFGCVVGIARTAPHRPAVFTVRPQDWQRAVLPNSGKRVDYDELTRVVGEYIRRDKATAIAFDSLDPDLREHALDAGAIALMGAYRLNECRAVRSRA